MDEQILLLLVMTRRYFFEKIREIKTEEKMMKNKEKRKNPPHSTITY